MKKLLAYPNNDKDMYLDRVRKHRELDELVRGTGWESNGKTRGCAVGCCIHSYDHKQYPILLGVSEQIAHLEDWLFENLPENHLEWPEQFLSAITPGADLSRVWPEWCIRMLTRRLRDIGIGSEPWHIQCRESMQGVIAIYRHKKPAGNAAWRAAGRAAGRAAEAAGKATEAAGAAWAATGTAWAAWAAGRAAWAAGTAAEIRLMASDLLELLRAAK